jgi:hypothetical protein
MRSKIATAVAQKGISMHIEDAGASVAFDAARFNFDAQPVDGNEARGCIGCNGTLMALQELIRHRTSRKAA